MSARWASAGVFAVNGAAVGTWVAHIPWTQERFGLSAGVLGLVLVAMAAAVVIVFPLAGQAVARHGTVAVMRTGGFACALAVVLPVLAPHPALVALALFLLGAASATMDVAMNSHGVEVEHRLGRPVLSSLHAGWAFGGMAGAAFAAAAAAAGADPRITVLVASAALVAVLSVCLRRVGPGVDGAGDQTPGFTLPSRGIALLAVLCLLVMVTEGAMADWGGLYLRGEIGAGAAVAALAYAFFTAGMTVGRLAGDDVNRRIGPVALLRCGALLTALPLVAMLLLADPVVALAGLFLVGLGVANGVPLMFSAAGRRAGTASGPAIAAVSSMGSVGFLAGPPLIGLVADAATLPWALSALVPGALAVLVLARRAAGGIPGAAPGAELEPRLRDPVTPP